MLESPWLYQFRRTRPVHRLSEYQRTDVVVIGGGISGTVTAYHLLRDTPFRVVLLDAHLIGHGASGKNAGLLIADVERPLKELVDIFGEDTLAPGLRALESTWDILDDMRADLGLKTPIHPANGYIGFANFAALISEMENAFWWKRAGVSVEVFGISRTSAWSTRIPARYQGLLELIEPTRIQEALEHDNKTFEAIVFHRMSCANTALLSEEIAQTLLARFGSRFSLFEDTHVTEVTCAPEVAHVRAGSITIDARRVVLCTNGFEQFHIKDVNGVSLDPKFHTLVKGEVAYMEGFLADASASTKGFIYLETDKPSEDPYIYASRRPFEFDTKPKTLISIGGPEFMLPDTSDYDPFHPFPTHAEKDIDRFLGSGQRLVSPSDERAFRWHGVMGYTPNRVRCIGFEPCEPSLMYNLGCNGIGIMPAMYGGLKIAQLLMGKDDGVHLFDPQDRRCLFTPQNQKAVPKKTPADQSAHTPPLVER